MSAEPGMNTSNMARTDKHIYHALLFAAMHALTQSSPNRVAAAAPARRASAIFFTARGSVLRRL